MSVLVKPLVTEKVSSMNEKGKYGFVVKKTANKVEIKKEIEEKIDSLKKVKDSGTKEEIEAASQTLARAAQKIGEAIYKQSGVDQPPQPSGDSGEAEKK